MLQELWYKLSFPECFCDSFFLNGAITCIQYSTRNVQFMSIDNYIHPHKHHQKLYVEKYLAPRKSPQAPPHSVPSLPVLAAFWLLSLLLVLPAKWINYQYLCVCVCVFFLSFKIPLSYYYLWYCNTLDTFMLVMNH